MSEPAKRPASTSSYGIDVSADPVALARDLIRCPSVTPAEGGAIAYLEKLLKGAGFTVKRVTFSEPGASFVLGYDSPRLRAGFQEPEPEAHRRWTTGTALLPRRCLDLFEGPFEIAIHVVCTARYAIAEDWENGQMSAA